WGALAEVHRDENGLCWPAPAAPVQVHLVAIKLDVPAVAQTAERVYERLQQAGLCVLFDDRGERPGAAFKDADLLGAPLRLTVSPRALEAGGIEAKWRSAAESEVVAEDALASLIAPLLS
ncbi:MAG: His/Gly/Thr/Pro-type tRNA ligase C-terminal domain-containing protein, partial [Anaerolineae bacterium]